MVHIHWVSHARLQFFFLIQGFKAVFFHHIVIVSDINYHNIVYYLGKCEALHEITDFVHEMISVWADTKCIKCISVYKGGQTRSSFATQFWRATVAVQPLHVMVRHCEGCVAGLHAIVARQSCSVSTVYKRAQNLK